MHEDGLTIPLVLLAVALAIVLFGWIIFDPDVIRLLI